jgi:hypothetical protein
MSTIFRALILISAVSASGAALADCSAAEKQWGCTPTSQVPEMDAAGLPVAMGLLVSFVMWRRDRQKK